MYLNRYSTLLLATTLFLSACSFSSRLSPENKERISAASNHNGTNFENTVPVDSPTVGKTLNIIVRMATKDRSKSVPVSPIPLVKLTRERLDKLSNDKLHIVKLGHSSLLLKNYGEYWLIDPVFSNRASPISFAGPRRFHPTPIAIDELPPIARVLISHNHYDHLDKSAISSLASANTQFMAPLGVETYLERWGVPADAITSFAWWEELRTTDALIAFTPTLHFSGRTFMDRDKSLWGSWVIKTKDESLFFSGDSGYFDGFKTIGEKYGPFDLTFIETGAYASEWKEMHMLPEKSVQAHIDLGGIAMLPIHNGTFDLAFHPWQEPLERVQKEAEKRGVKLITPIAGEFFTLDQLPGPNPWWRDIR